MRVDFFASFAHLTDPRVNSRCRHQFGDILALLLCGTLAGCDDLPEICDYGPARLAFLREELGLGFANGIPSTDTLERMMQALQPSELAAVLRTCAGELAGRQLCLDGKQHRPTTPAGRHMMVIGNFTLSGFTADANVTTITPDGQMTEKAVEVKIRSAEKVAAGFVEVQKVALAKVNELSWVGLARRERRAQQL